MKHLSKRLLSLAMVVMLLAAMLPFSVSAEEIVYTEVADEAALLAAIAAGQNPKLTASFTLSADLSIPAETAITLDLNGQTLTTFTSVTDAEGAVTCTQYHTVVFGTLTILDTSEGKTGTIVSVPAGDKIRSFTVNTGATLNLKGGTIIMDGTDLTTTAAYCIRNDGTTTVENTTVNVHSTGNNAFCFFNTGSLTINNGTVLHSTSNGAKNSAAAIYATLGTIEVNGGSAYAKNTSTSTSYGIQLNAATSTAADKYPTLTINGGTITAEHSGYRDARAVYATRGNVVINDGTIIANTDGAYKKVGSTAYYNPAAGVYLTASATATINGGTISATASGGRAYALNVASTSAEATVNDGTLTATTSGGYTGYGICAGGLPDANLGGKLTLNGGTVNSIGTKATTVGIYMDGPKTFTMNGGTVNVDTTGGTVAAQGISIGTGSTADLKGGTVTVNSASGNATGINATGSLTTDTTGETPVITGASRATVNFPADSKEMNITTIAKTGNAYGINADGSIINANSPKLTITAKTGFAATSGSTMKYAYGLSLQGHATITAGNFKAYGTNTSATKVQAFGMNNSRKKVTVTLADSTTMDLYDLSTATISGGSFYGSANKSTGAGIMTNYSGGLTITGDAKVTGTDYALWTYRGDITVTGGTFSTNGTRVVNIASNANVDISGGTFMHDSKTVIANSGTLNLTGGKFVGEVGRGSLDVLHLLGEGYTQDYYGEVIEGTPEAKYEVTANGTTAQYASYWDAMEAITADTTGNGTFKLLSDIFLGISVDFTASVNVDLNGKTWVQSNGMSVNVTAVGTENAITRVTNGTLINDNASVAIYIRAGAMQLDGVTAYGHTTMPVCYTAPTGEYAADNFVKNSNLVTNRFYTFSYRTQTGAQTDMDCLFENTNLINLYSKSAGGEIFFTGWGDSTGQYTIGENVNMYTVYGSSALARQNTTEKNSSGNLILGTAGTETVKAVAADGCTIHDRQDAASYTHINAILAGLNSKADIDIDTTPSLYKWSTEHTYADGACTCGDTTVATIGDDKYTDLNTALMSATEGQTVTVKGNITTTADLMVVDNVTLDLNGKQLDAGSLTIFGNLVDGTTGGDALVISDNFHIAGTSFLPLYDNAAGGYRFYKYTFTELGHKVSGENTVKFGFRLTLDNTAGYTLLQDADNKLSFTANISWSGSDNSSIPYPFSTATMAAFAEAMAEGLTNYAITLTVKGTDVLGADGTLTFVPQVSTGCGMTLEGAGSTWAASNT